MSKRKMEVHTVEVTRIPEQSPEYQLHFYGRLVTDEIEVSMSREDMEATILLMVAILDT